MKRSEVNVENLLNQLSEEKINRVVDSQVVKAGWSSQEDCHESESNSNEQNASGGATLGGGASVGIGASGSGGLGIGI